MAFSLILRMASAFLDVLVDSWVYVLGDYKMVFCSKLALKDVEKGQVVGDHNYMDY